MQDEGPFDWDPRSPAVLADQCAAFDEMRRRCPVARSEFLGWSLFRHEDVMRVLADPGTFSNQVSQHRSVPNGMDPPEHGVYRAALESLFDAELLRQYEPTCRGIAAALLDASAASDVFDCIEDFAMPFAARCQCAFLGWPDLLAERMCDWTRRNRSATLAGDRPALAEIAREFRDLVTEMLRQRRAAPAQQDITARLVTTRVNGACLTDEDLTSLFRNWTVGEVGSLTASVGILVHELACRPALQSRVRSEPALLAASIDEVLRMQGPLVANSRRALRDVEIGGRRIASGERISLLWISANRDEGVFEAADEVHPERAPAQASKSLVFGAGIHVCPGAPLARLELRVALEELLRRCRTVELEPNAAPTRAAYPENGWTSLPVRWLR